jgi:transcription elongation GreA/GreB family factor
MNPEVQNIVAAGKLPAADGEKLSKLEPGTFCVHKSWGVGKIAEWDLLGDRLLIDFEGKPGHPLKLAFAISSLEILPQDHLLARRLGDLDSLKKMSAENAPALVELALKSSGNTLHLDDLEKLLKGRIISDADYKKWWEAAKRALKTHRHIVVPAKRTEKLVLRDQAEAPGAQMVSFLAARDLKTKLATLASIQKDIDLFADAKAELVPVFQDISDTARKSVKLNLKECLQLLLSRDELIDSLGATAPMGSMKISDLICETKEVLADAIKSLSSSALARIYRAFPEAFPNRVWVPEILHHLTKTGGRAVAEIAVVLDANDERDVLAEALKKSLRNRMLSSDLLIWMARERKGLAESVFDIDLGHAILGVIESDHMEGGPKRTGRLQDLLSDDKTLLGEMVADADDEDVRLLAKRLINGSLFDELTRRSLMARIIKARPEMEQMMDDSAAATKSDSLIVSWESLEKKKLELDDLVNVKIPENKREIQIARDEGDLRENGGYKAARDQQSVLLRMQGKMERELRNARGTDFANVSTDKVGIGTIVDVEDVPSGEKETFTILGAWDGDLDKNIISYLSESAKALIGKAVGEEVELPTDSHHISRKARVTGIRAYKQ